MPRKRENTWADADRISDKIVDLLKQEIGKTEPCQMLAGVLLATCSLLQTAPANGPTEIGDLKCAIDACLRSMCEEKEANHQ